MGNTWKGISEDRLKETEKAVLLLSGIPYEEYDIKEVVIDDQGNSVHTLHVGKVINCLTF